MISLAMVLILIIGINFVFRSATDAVSAGQALNGINTDAQSTQPCSSTTSATSPRTRRASSSPASSSRSSSTADDARTGSDPNVIAIDNAGNTPTAISTRPGAQPIFLQYSPPPSSTIAITAPIC